MNIQKTSRIRLSLSDTTIITNAKSLQQQTIDIPIEIGEEGVSDSHFCDNTVTYEVPRRLRLPFSCSITASDPMDSLSIDTIFDVTSKYINGRPHCEIAVVDMPRRVINQLSTTDVMCALQVMLTDHGKDNMVASDVVKLPFVPAFVLSSYETELSPEKSTAFFKVIGVPAQLNNIKVSRLFCQFPTIKPRSNTSIPYWCAAWVFWYTPRYNYSLFVCLFVG